MPIRNSMYHFHDARLLMTFLLLEALANRRVRLNAEQLC